MRKTALVLALIAFQATGCRVAHASPDEAQMKAAAKAEIAALAAIMTDMHLGKKAVVETLELLTLVKLRCNALMEDGRATLKNAQADNTLTSQEREMIGVYTVSVAICEDSFRAAAAFTFGLKQ